MQIFNYASGPYPEERKLAWAGILVLIGLIFVLNLIIRYFASRARSVAAPSAGLRRLTTLLLRKTKA